MPISVRGLLRRRPFCCLVTHTHTHTHTHTRLVPHGPGLLLFPHIQKQNLCVQGLLTGDNPFMQGLDYTFCFCVSPAHPSVCPDCSSSLSFPRRVSKVVVFLARFAVQGQRALVIVRRHAAFLLDLDRDQSECQASDDPTHRYSQRHPSQAPVSTLQKSG